MAILPLNSVRSIVNEIIKDKPIFTIIPLFASVSLLLSLLQIYMNKDFEKTDKIWKIVACPVHWAFHLAVRFLLLLAILATFLIPLLILSLILIKIHGISWEWIKSLSDKIVQWVISWEWIKSLSDDIDVAFQIASLFTGLGLFLFFLKREELYKPVLNVIGKIFQVFRGIRLPKIDVKKSLTETWMYDIKFIWLFIKKTFTETLKLIPAVLVLYIILVCGHFSTRDHKKWQKNVTENLDIIRTDTADLILLRSSGLSPAYLSGKGDTISLVYPPQGDLVSKKGLCPEGDNLIWLKLFKQAILKCAEDGLKKQQPLKLKVQGFASAAPVRVNDDTTKSNSLNCEIANQRAEALIYFLILPDSIPYVSTECKAVLENSSMWGRKENELCTRSAKPDTNAWKKRGFNVPDTTRSDTIVWKGTNFDVSYKPWPNYDEMVGKKPVQDSKRPDLEFLNRTVQIIIEREGDCWTKAVGQQ